MTGILGVIKKNFPYTAGALALVTGLFAHSSWSLAVKYEQKELPMIIDSMKWPSVSGRITGHDIAEVESGRLSHSPKTAYYAEPAYSYIVNGKNYSGKKLSFLHANNGTGIKREDAEKILKKYPVGTIVRVYYSPAKPSVSTLIPGNREMEKGLAGEISSFYSFFMLFTGISVVLIIATVLTAEEFRSSEKKNNNIQRRQ